MSDLDAPGRMTETRTYSCRCGYTDTDLAQLGRHIRGWDNRIGGADTHPDHGEVGLTQRDLEEWLERVAYQRQVLSP